MENIVNGEDEKGVESLGAKALAELDEETRIQSVTTISHYLNRIFGNCIWVGILYLIQKLTSSNDKNQANNQADFLDLVVDIIQLLAFLVFPLQNLYYWGKLKDIFSETKLGEVMNFNRAYKIAIVYTLSFFLAVGVVVVLFLLGRVFDVTLSEDTLIWWWRIAQYSFYFSVAVLLWSFFLAYVYRSGFKDIVNRYGNQELIDIVEKQYSIKNTLF